MPDFTLKTYNSLLTQLQISGYDFLSLRGFLSESRASIGSQNPIDNAPLLYNIILRHDVDKLPQNSLRFARIQHDLGIKASYYFRAVPESWNVDIIKEISALGHEVGYHYEDIDFAQQNLKNKDTSPTGRQESKKSERSGDPGTPGIKVEVFSVLMT